MVRVGRVGCGRAARGRPDRGRAGTLPVGGRRGPAGSLCAPEPCPDRGPRRPGPRRAGAGVSCRSSPACRWRRPGPGPGQRRRARQGSRPPAARRRPRRRAAGARAHRWRAGGLGWPGWGRTVRAPAAPPGWGGRGSSPPAARRRPAGAAERQTRPAHPGRPARPSRPRSRRPPEWPPRSVPAGDVGPAGTPGLGRRVGPGPRRVGGRGAACRSAEPPSPVVVAHGAASSPGARARRRPRGRAEPD